MAHIEEIPEAGASAEIAAIYHDIKAVTGVGLVNLIYRNWATMPPALDWAWGALRPLYAGGRVAKQAKALVDGLDLGDMPVIPMEAFRVAGVGDHAVGTAADIVAAYNLGNSQNLIVMPALARFIAAGGAGRPARDAADEPAPERPRDQPPIVALADMTDETQAMIDVMSAPISPADHPLVPSLYRHLAQWPVLLAMAAASALAPGRVAAVEPIVRTAFERADAAAEALAAEMAPPPGCDTPNAETLAHIGDMAAQYARGPIATMTVLGGMLRRALPDVKIMY
jgi:hypothetical protein